LFNALEQLDMPKNAKIENLGDPVAALKQLEKHLYVHKTIVRTGAQNKQEYTIGPRALVEFGRKNIYKAFSEVRCLSLKVVFRPQRSPSFPSISLT
jgi:hypothetical protein